MKKRFKVIIAVLLALSLSAFVLAACSGDTNADKIDSSELGGYDYSQEAAFGEVPDENVRIDGVLDEDLWKNLNYMRHTDPAREGVTINVTTHFSEKGLYIGAYSNDKKIYWNGKNYYHWNTHFFFRIASGNTTSYSQNVREILIDANNVFPGSTRVNAKSAVLGEGVNTGQSDGLSVEMFLTWDAIGIKLATDGEGNAILPENIKLYWRYRFVENNNGTNSKAYDSRNTFDYNAGEMGNYAFYGKDGFISADKEGAVIGDAFNGVSKSAGWDVSRESEGVVKSINPAYQGIFFKQAYASSFVMSAKIRPIKGLTGNIGAKAGLLMYKNNNEYRAVTLDVSNENRSGDKLVSDKLFAVTHYPSDIYTLLPLNSGNNIEYSQDETLAELTVIKDGATLYYVVNGKLVYTEQQSYISDKVVAGFYASHAEVEFTDYSFTSYDSNSEGINAEIAKYAYKITVPGMNDVTGGNITSDVMAVPKGDLTAKANITITTQSGYIPNKITINGKDVTEKANAESVKNVYTITNITEDMSVGAEFIQIPQDQRVTVSGKVVGADREGAVVDSAQMKIFAKDGSGDIVPLYMVSYVADSRGQFTLTLVKGYTYVMEITGLGYRKLVYETEVIDSDIIDDTSTSDIYEGLEITAQANVVGGSVNSSVRYDQYDSPVNLNINVSSNSTPWDLSREDEAIAVYNSNVPDMSTIFFTGKADVNAVMEVTITNTTDINLFPDYEKDPSAGFVITDGGTRMFIGLLRQGIRVLPTGGWNGDQFDANNLVKYNTVNSVGSTATLKIIREGRFYYVFIDDVLVYTYENYTFTIGASLNGASVSVDKPTAFGFAVTTSYPINIEFTDYRCVTGQEAIDEIYNTIYSEPKLTESSNPYGIELKGLNGNGMVKQGDSFTAAIENLNGKAYELKVYGTDSSVYKKYIISESCKEVEIAALSERYMNIDVTEIAAADLVTVTGKIRTEDGKALGDAKFKAYYDNRLGEYQISYDGEGNYTMTLPKGEYELSAVKSGYYTSYKNINITEGGALSEYVIPFAVLGGSVKVNNITYNSYNGCIKEEDTFQFPATPGNVTLYYTDAVATEYAVSIKTRINGTNVNSKYYANDNVQGICIVDGSRQLNIMLFNAGFRVLIGGWNQVNMVETVGTGWDFYKDDAGSGYVDIVMTVVRHGNTLYVYVGREESPNALAKDMQLYLMINPEEGVIPVSVGSSQHRISNATNQQRNEVLKSSLASILRSGVSNGAGYALHMNLAITTNKNNSMIFGAKFATDPEEIKILESTKIVESVGEGGTVKYSGEGYVKDGSANKYLAGKDITLNITPDAGKQVKSITVNGQSVQFTAGSDKKVTVTVNRNSSLNIAIEFTDVTYTAEIVGIHASYINNVNKIVAVAAGREVELVFSKSSSKITVEIPVGTWTLRLLNRNGQLLGTVENATITGTETEVPQFTFVAA